MSFPEKALSVLGGEVKAAFAKVLQACNTKHKDSIYLDIRDAAERFELWAINLGLYHRGHSSLDYRFRDASSVNGFTINLLESIRDNLTRCEHSQNILESKYLLIMGVADADDQNVAADEEEDISDDSDFDELSQFSWTQIVVSSIQAAIVRLFRIASKLQDPRLRIMSEKIAKYTEIDPETGVDLMDIYAKYDEAYVREHVARFSGTGTDFSCSPELISRLARANTLRRKQFKWWRGHKVKMQTDISVASFDQKQTLHNEMGPAMSAPTTATRLDPELIDIRDDVSTIASSNSVPHENTESGPGLRVPGLPRRLQNQESFECPYCCILCSKKTGQPKHWKNHVLHDLRPYICTNLDCIYGDQLFDTIGQWKSHEASHISQSCENEPPKSDCGICGENSVSLVHIAAHLEEIAIFALPMSMVHSSGASEDEKSSQQWLKDKFSGLVGRPTWNFGDEEPQKNSESEEMVSTRIQERHILETTEMELKTQEKEAMKVRTILEAQLVKSDQLNKECEEIATEIRTSDLTAPQKESLIAMLPLERKEIETKQMMFRDRTEAVITTINEAKKKLEVMAISVQAAMATPPTEKHQPIRFKDALDRDFVFPFHLCATWEGMENLIKLVFLNDDVIGEHVANGHYDLIGPNSEIILPVLWETIIEPDWAITMHMWPVPEPEPAHEPKPEPSVEGVRHVEDASTDIGVNREGNKFTQ